MLSLDNLASKRHDLPIHKRGFLHHLIGRAGSNGAWKLFRSDPRDGGIRFELYHHGTLMLDWTEFPDGRFLRVDTVSQGWNSVSDQRGMNVFFRQVGIPLYFSRAEGTISPLSTSRNQYYNAVEIVPLGYGF